VRHMPSEKVQSVKVSKGMLPFIGNPAVLYCTSRLAPTFSGALYNVPAFITIRSNPRFGGARTQTEQITAFRYLTLASWPLPCQQKHRRFVLQVRCRQCGPRNLTNFVAFTSRLHHSARASQDLVFRPRLGYQIYSLLHDSLGCQGYGLKIKYKKYERNRDDPGREEMIANAYLIYISFTHVPCNPSDLYHRSLVVMLGHHHVHQVSIA
jgi:hypothetical protein